ncbi:hypothetical protein [Rhizobium sp. BK538]|uniref:hypothetical protein n=1 Tax=Rhizobium sp. BK538 TaxID=2586984 RepID=UPI001802B647|nr:hypothetical protein [Rhizobium sp. BK538]MBB4166449.1 hypothetical protein [Rhizobium sp. BK538]
MLSTRIISLIAVTVAILLLLGLGARADTNRATVPADFDKFVLYATYDRGSSKEEAFGLPETIELSKSGKPLPAGTLLVLGIWTDYKLTGYFGMRVVYGNMLPSCVGFGQHRSRTRPRLDGTGLKTSTRSSTAGKPAGSRVVLL